MKQNQSFKIILAAMFAALVCVATMLIHIPTPGTNGYVNLGDGIILTCAYLLSPGYAVAAAGLGSMLADLLSGYLTYAPGTLVIKGLVALIAALISKRLIAGNTSSTRIFSIRLIAGLIAELFMVAGYFLYESTLLSYGMGALASVPANMVQGAAGVIIALVLTPVLTGSKEIDELLKKFRS